MFCWLIYWVSPDVIKSSVSAEWWANGHLVLFCLIVVRQDQRTPQSLFMYLHISTQCWGTVMLLTDGGLSVNDSVLVGGVSFESRAFLWQPRWLQFTQPEGFKPEITGIWSVFLELFLFWKQLPAVGATTGAVRVDQNRTFTVWSAKQWAELLLTCIKQGELQIQVIILCKATSDCFYIVIVKVAAFKVFFSLISQLIPRRKDGFTDQADKPVPFQGAFWFSVSLWNVAFWTVLQLYICCPEPIIFLFLSSFF